VKLGRDHLAPHPLGLVHRQPDSGRRFANLSGDTLVLRCKPLSCINDEQHGVRLKYRLARLPSHLGHQAFAGNGLEAAAVDDDELMLAASSATILTVAREAWKVCHQRIAASGQSIEERRLANIGTPHQGENR
jgi:hypothetical protein